MGKLVLTRRAGESVKLVEANGREWFVVLRKTSGVFGKPTSFVLVSDGGMTQTDKHLLVYETIHFAGGSLELRPTKRRWPDQAVLAFDFPQDVKIVRTEIA